MEKEIFEHIKNNLNWKEKIIFRLFRTYTYKVYVLGIKSGFNWRF